MLGPRRIAGFLLLGSLLLGAPRLCDQILFRLQVADPQVAELCGEQFFQQRAIFHGFPFAGDSKLLNTAYSGASRTAFRGEAEQDSGLIPNSIPG